MFVVRYFLLKNTNEVRKELLGRGLLLLEPQYTKHFERLDNCDYLVSYYSVLDEKLLGRFKVKSTPQEIDNLMEVPVPPETPFTHFCEVEWIRKVTLPKARLVQFKFIENAV
jgi:hypothetical protein